MSKPTATPGVTAAEGTENGTKAPLPSPVIESCPCVCRPGRMAITQAFKECDKEVFKRRCTVVTCKKNGRVDGISCCDGNEEGEK